MKKRVFGYDLVRALAIFLVLIAHSLGFLYAGTLSFYISFLSGFFGVELFFILSGVLIGKLLIHVFEKKEVLKHLKNFIFRRWLRTLPMYFLMLIIYYLGNYYLDSVKNGDVVFWKYLFFLQNFTHVQPTFFGVSWSLSIEEWFYLLFPFILLIIKLCFRKISIKSLFFLVIGVFSIYFCSVRIISFSNDYVFYEGARKIAFARLDAISFGVFVAVLLYFYPLFLLKYRKFFFLVGLIFICLNQYVIIANYYKNLYYFNTFYYTILGVGLGLLFPFIYHFKCDQKAVNKSVTFISSISYSLYLVHWLVYKLLIVSYFNFIPSSAKFFLFFALSLFFSWLLYRFFEQPILMWRDRKIGD